MNEPIVVDDVIELETRWDVPDRPDRLTVFCHPDPTERGTMSAPLMKAVTGHLVSAGFAVLRFNFRGVGSSTGHHDFGTGEMDDIAAAVSTATNRYPELPFGICGWSFGAATALRWQARDASTAPYAGIAPPVDHHRSPALPAPEELAAAPRRFIIGDRDQVVAVDDLERYAASIGAEMEVLGGSDHFFYFREEQVAAAVAKALSEPA